MLAFDVWTVASNGAKSGGPRVRGTSAAEGRGVVAADLARRGHAAYYWRARSPCAPRFAASLRAMVTTRRHWRSTAREVLVDAAGR